MPAILRLVLDGTREGSGPPFDRATAVEVKDQIAVIGMPKGTAGGLPTVLFRGALDDGRTVFFETTLRLFTTAMQALAAHYGNGVGATGRFPRGGPVNQTDEGELRLAVAPDNENGIVRVMFGKPVAWLGLPTTEARELAKLLNEMADNVDKAKA